MWKELNPYILQDINVNRTEGPIRKKETYFLHIELLIKPYVSIDHNNAYLLWYKIEYIRYHKARLRKNLQAEYK